MSNLIHQPSKIVLIVGYAGLIPFVGLSAASVLIDATHLNSLLFCLLAYGATIISFLGAIHWGLTMRDDSPSQLQLIWGVIPSLAAWLSLIFSTQLGLAIQCLMVWVCFGFDYRTYPTLHLAAWLKMRFNLTLIASLSLLTPLIFLA
jgi:Protein of unknown function (DUF3429)